MAKKTVEDVSLHETTRSSYLNYALSVITSRALPDVRDGFKPVHRRILYAMHSGLGLKAGGRYRKSAAVVGEVMAKYHPHGDSSIYEALVRMAQPFAMRHTLVDGQGNFGSLDGDNAAAMRYTECKLKPIASALLDQVKLGTVSYSPNYDGQHKEPDVLPVKFPHLLVNGSEGIAVGMATKIPPHNLREVSEAAMALIDDPSLDEEALFKFFKGPDFPTGGVILNTEASLLEIYRTGRGSAKVQGKWTTEKKGRRVHIVFTEIPYGVNKSQLVEKIGKLVGERKIPIALDVRDESTEEVRIVVEVKKQEHVEPVVAFLFKNTPLQTTFPVNLTCLFPSQDEEIPLKPAQASLGMILRAWLEFRYEVTVRLIQHDLKKLRERLHLLEGFEKIFGDLEEALKLIRASKNKAESRAALMGRFSLDEDQANAVLEASLYKLSGTEISFIKDELSSKRAEAAQCEANLKDPQKLWGFVRSDLKEVISEYGEKRRTEINPQVKELEFSEEDLVVAEDTHLIVTQEGWVKRQGSFSSLAKTRTREGDEIRWVYKTSTKNTVTFCTDRGMAYTSMVANLPNTTGYGDPVQKHFNFADGEKIIAVLVNPDEVEGKTLMAATRAGRTVRVALSMFSDPSNKSGRKYAFPATERDRILNVGIASEGDWGSFASTSGRALCYPAEQVPIAKYAAKGVKAMALSKDDEVLAFRVVSAENQGVTVKTNRGREELVTPAKYSGTRNTQGKEVIKRGSFSEWVRPVETNLKGGVQ